MCYNCRMEKRVKDIRRGFYHLVSGLEDRRRAIQGRLRAHHTLYAFLGGIGVVMFWHGLWEGLNLLYQADGFLSFIGHPAVSMTIGILILTFSGLFVLELVGREARELEEKIEDVREDIEDVQEDLEDVADNCKR